MMPRSFDRVRTVRVTNGSIIDFSDVAPEDKAEALRGAWFASEVVEHLRFCGYQIVQVSER